MISHEHRFLFLHMPKTAGSSVVSALSKYPHCKKFKSGHPDLDNYFRNFGNNVRDYFIFTIARNPFSRAVSAFKYLQKGGSNGSMDKKSRDEFGMEDLDFKQFVLKYFHKKTPLHFRSQVAFIGKHFNCVDFIGKLENLQEDFEIICDKIGIPRRQVPHVNKTKHKHYTEYYDDETRSIVAKKYAKDIEYFNYKFGE